MEGCHQSGRVIVTSRLASWPARYHRLELGVLDSDHAAGLLMRGVADGDEEAARSLAADLDGLPLALQQVVGYCRQNAKSLSGYLALFRDARCQARMLAAGPRDNKPVAATWQVSVRQIRKRTPRAAVLLGVLAYLAPDAIPRTLLTAIAGCHVEGPLVRLSGIIDELDLDEALGTLHDYSLIQLTTETITVHRLVQAAVRASHDQATADGCALFAVGLVSQAMPPLRREAWPAYEALLPHALAAGTGAAAASSHQDPALLLLNRVGIYQRERGLYADAVRTLQLVLDRAEEEYPDDFLRLLDVIDTVTTTLLQAGQRPRGARARAAGADDRRA